MKNPFIFLFGYTLISAPRESAAAVAEFFRKTGIVYGDFSFSEERISFRVSAFSARRAIKGLSESGLDVRVEARRGLPAVAWRYRRRWGAFVGVALFVFILSYAPLLLWDIRIIGGEGLDPDGIKATLRECGLREGELLKSIDTPQIETRAIIAREDIGWISINLLGSVAEVEIIEYSPPDISELSFCADIAAGHDGKILWIEDARGYQLKEIGEEVRAGEVILSGTYPADEEAGLPERYAVAKGKVFARTERSFQVSVPLKYEKKVYTGREKIEKNLIFFNKELKIYKNLANFFGNGGKMYTKYDTIRTVEYATLPGGILLPFGIITERQAEYELCPAERSEESGAALARYILRGLEKQEISEGSLLKKSESVSISEEAYLLSFKGEYIENISVVIPRDE